MKNQPRYNSCKNLNKRVKVINLSTPDIEESINPVSMPITTKAETLAQRIPKLPESKFFPSSTRHYNNSLELNPQEKTNLTINYSGAKITNRTMMNPTNTSSLSQLSNENSMNFSQFSNKTEQQPSSIKWTDIELPTNPLAVLSKFNNKLAKYEMAEILKFPQVWCIGIEAEKVKALGNANDNFGYDDENCDYKAVMHDHIGYRYELFEILGKGSFGQVFKVFDYKHKIFCALKIIKNKKRFNQQAMVEIEILKTLRKKDENNSNNIVHIMSSFSFRNHICICFEMLSMNLYHFLKFNRFQGLSLSLIKRFAIQILQALVLLQQTRVIHCDLKPENILLKYSNRSAIKVIDFGSSCFTDKKIYTYIQSRFYRAPEVILGLGYSQSIDMWSFGCILVELFTGYPIFPGDSELQQLLCIMEYLGVPNQEYLAKATRKKLFFESDGAPKIQPDGKGRVRKPGSKRISDVLRKADNSFVRLVECCFVWEPAFRITPQQALMADWVAEGSKGKKE